MRLNRRDTEMHTLITLSTLLTLTLSYANGFTTTATNMDKPQRCQLERTYKMIGYNCANLNLKEIPQWLKGNLQILDLSFNRIRDLNAQSFTRYGDVMYLYLFENMIQNIAEGTFSELSNLEAIDLSSNALKTIPLELFRLPVLRNLYVASNALHDLEADLHKLEKPVKAPLQIISLAECWLEQLPNFGILPDLWQLNISSNPMTELTVEQFAPMCNLRSLDMNATKTELCACQAITIQLTARRTKILNSHPHCTPLFSAEQSVCGLDGDNLDGSAVATTNSAEFQQCMDVRKTRKLETEAKTTWINILIGVSVCIVLVLLMLYYFHRRNAIKMRKKKQTGTANRSTTPIHRVMIPSTVGGVGTDDNGNDDEVPIVENGKRDKLINDCD